MVPNSDERELYMEFGYRITSSHEVTKGVGGKGRKK